MSWRTSETSTDGRSRTLSAAPLCMKAAERDSVTSGQLRPGTPVPVPIPRSLHRTAETARGGGARRIVLDWQSILAVPWPGRVWELRSTRSVSSRVDLPRTSRGRSHSCPVPVPEEPVKRPVGHGLTSSSHNELDIG